MSPLPPCYSAQWNLYSSTQVIQVSRSGNGYAPTTNFCCEWHKKPTRDILDKRQWQNRWRLLALHWTHCKANNNNHNVWYWVELRLGLVLLDRHQGLWGVCVCTTRHTTSSSILVLQGMCRCSVDAVLVVQIVSCTTAGGRACSARTRRARAGTKPILYCSSFSFSHIAIGHRLEHGCTVHCLLGTIWSNFYHNKKPLGQ